MDQFFGFISGIVWLPIALVVAAVVFLVFIYVRSRYKIAKPNEVLVITGGKAPVIRVGGGAFVPPFRDYAKVNVGLRTIESTNDETHTSTLVPVSVAWTANVRGDTTLDENGNISESLRQFVIGFSNFDGNIDDSIQQTLEAGVREVVATMTPSDLVIKKADFSEAVDENVRKTIAVLGFELVSLNIGKISDSENHYKNLAAKDREERRREADIIQAEANQAISVRAAETDQASKAAEQARDLAVAEQDRALALRRSEIQAETDIAKADADIAGQLQRERRNQELAAREGEVAVIREQQSQAAAIARREVDVTQAETAKQTKQIQAEAEAQKAEIDAQAAAEVTRRNAQAQADAAGIAAQGEADALNRTTEARARQVRETGLAQAEVTQAQGEATAAATLAQGRAEAEVQRLNAEALAANDGANLKVRIAEIQSTTQITVSTEVGKAMATIGTNAKFIDMGGNSSSEGDLLSRVLGNIPALFGKLDVQSDALHGTTFGGLLGSVAQSVKNGEPIVDAVVVDEDKPADTASEPAVATETVDAPAPSVEPESTDESTTASTASEPETQELTPAAKVDAMLNPSLTDTELLAVAKQFRNDAGVVNEIAQRYGLPTETVVSFLANLDDESNLQMLRSLVVVTQKPARRGR